MPFIQEKNSIIGVTGRFAKNLYKVDQRIAEMTRHEAVKIAPKDTGAGIASIDAVNDKIFAFDYMRDLDIGVPPGVANPDPQKLDRWGERVLGKPGLGFVLARSIRRKGLRPRNWFIRGYNNAIAKHKFSINAKLGEVIREALWMKR